MCQPFPHGVIQAGLPAFASGAQARKHIGVKTDRGGHFGDLQRRPAALTPQLGKRLKKLGRHDFPCRAGAFEPIGVKLARIRVGGNARVELSVFFSVWPMNRTT